MTTTVGQVGTEPRLAQGQEPVTFDRAGFKAGVRQSMPFAVGVLAYGLAFGVLTRQAGLSLGEAALMCATVFAGASQFVAVGLWATPLPAGTIILATFLVNLRYALMSATLRPWLRELSPLKSYGTLFFLTDEGWALGMGAYARGRRNAALLLGSGLLLYLTWLGATLCGRLLGAVVRDPARWGLDFAFTAVVIALLRGFWSGRADLVAWVVAAAVAVAAHGWLPGTWYILLGGVAGTLTAVLVGGSRHGG